jgi:class 3 adenylate cyclase
MLKGFQHVALVSCDIVGHSAVSDQLVQLRRITQLNEVVRAALVRERPGQAVWASGGDGGHALFFREDWVGSAVRLISQLRRWALDEAVPLRITGHLGDVVTFEGADGRPQPVGDGINEAGAILELGSQMGIVVSEEFRQGVERNSVGTVQFHDERDLLLRGRLAQRLVLMSLPGLVSEWAVPDKADRLAMRDAAQAGDAWQTLYHAKRALQLNSADLDVDVTLRKLRPEDYWYQPREGGDADRRINPFFGFMEARALREVIKSSQLIERKYNEILCRYGDDGDTMFVVLYGSVGVYNSEGEPGRNPARPDFIIGRGEVAGELAFLLNRQRTADLVTLSDTAMLAFSFEEISSRLVASAGSRPTLKRVDQFMTARILEHVGHNAAFLIGKDDSGPLAVGAEPPESLLEDLRVASRTVVWQPADGPLTLAELTHQWTSHRGLYTLVSGRLECTLQPGSHVDGEDFALVYVDVEPALLGPDHEYAVGEGGVKFLHIDQEALEQLPEPSRAAMMAALRREVAKRYTFDAFISYNFGDEETVERWRAALTDAGLNVYVNTLTPGERFTTSIQRLLLDSLVLLAAISPHTMVKPSEINWVLKEIAFREAHFEPPWILPIALPGADLDRFGLRYTMIDARHDEGTAIERAIHTVREIRSGNRQPPLLRGRQIAQEIS